MAEFRWILINLECVTVLSISSTVLFTDRIFYNLEITVRFWPELVPGVGYQSYETIVIYFMSIGFVLKKFSSITIQKSA